MFMLRLNTPDIALKEYYIQLLIAHVLFALGAAVFIF